MIIRGDARNIPLADGTVNCCATSPPYWGLRDYGVEGQLGLEPTPDEYVANMVEVFREVRRVLRDDGTLWLNLGDSYAASAGGGIGKNSQFLDRTAGRLGVREQKQTKVAGGLKPKDLCGIPWRVAFALQADGWYLRSDIIWSKCNPTPESVKDRPTKAHEYLFLLSKSERYYYNAKAIAEPVAVLGGRACGPKNDNSRNDADTTCTIRGDGIMRNKRTVWTVASEPYGGSHFATMPTALVKPCILAGSPLGGLVLDPFLGSGTVGMVAESLGRRWVGVELNPEYIKLAEKRTAQLGLLQRAV